MDYSYMGRIRVGGLKRLANELDIGIRKKNQRQTHSFGLNNWMLFKKPEKTSFGRWNLCAVYVNLGMPVYYVATIPNI